MASPFRIGRAKGDNPIRGQDTTATRIYYQSPPPRTAITDDNDDGGLSSRKLVYGDRGVTGVLESATTTYPRSKTLTILSKAAQGKPPVRYEPRYTPPDCFEAQDDALRKAEILLQETQRAGKRAQHVKTTKAPRRDSAVSEDDEPEPHSTVVVTRAKEPLATISPQENLTTAEPEEAPTAIASPTVRITTEPQIIITTTEPLSHQEEQGRDSPKRRKLSPSPRSSSPAQPAHTQRSKSRAESESRFVKPKTPPAPHVAPAARGESVVSVLSTDSKSSRRSRSSRAVIKDDLTIDSKFGMDADDSDEMEYMDKHGKWYVELGQGRPDWAVDARPKKRIVAQSGRRSTGSWRNK